MQDDIDTRNPIIIGSDKLAYKSPEEAGRDAAKELKTRIGEGTPTDEHLADNMIPLLGVCGGKIRTSKLTEHIKNNIYVTEKFLRKRIKKTEANRSYSLETI
jgi:RNA 3'-terminal phosphate cyclase